MMGVMWRKNSGEGGGEGDKDDALSGKEKKKCEQQAYDVFAGVVEGEGGQVSWNRSRARLAPSQAQFP